jgi:hypothetical protein
VVAIDGTSVDRVKRTLFRRRSRMSPYGHVMLRQDPIDTPGLPGYDVALIRPTSTRLLPSTRRLRPASLGPYLDFPVAGHLCGAYSGVVDASINGALKYFGDRTRIWENAWLVGPSGLAAHGDSGGAIVDTDGASVQGMLVGGSRREGSLEFEWQYAHDMESLERDVLRPLGAEIG